jgi:hypothetical protein
LVSPTIRSFAAAAFRRYGDHRTRCGNACKAAKPSMSLLRPHCLMRKPHHCGHLRTQRIVCAQRLVCPDECRSSTRRRQFDRDDAAAGDQDRDFDAGFRSCWRLYLGSFSKGRCAATRRLRSPVEKSAAIVRRPTTMMPVNCPRGGLLAFISAAANDADSSWTCGPGRNSRCRNRLQKSQLREAKSSACASISSLARPVSPRS